MLPVGFIVCLIESVMSAIDPERGGGDHVILILSSGYSLV